LAHDHDISLKFTDWRLFLLKEARNYEFNARNQITLWGPDGQILDYGGEETISKNLRTLLVIKLFYTAETGQKR
jgi:hypothetical protein